MTTTNLWTLDDLRAMRAQIEALRRVLVTQPEPTTAARWQDDAACDGADPRAFDATKVADAARTAAEHCAGCDVLMQCYRAAESDRAYEGVAGGALFKQGKEKGTNRDVRTVTDLIGTTVRSVAA